MSDTLYNFTSLKQDPILLQSTEYNNLIVQSLYFVIVNFFSTVAGSITVVISNRNQVVDRYFKLIFRNLIVKVYMMPIELVIQKAGKPVYVAGTYQRNLFMVDSLQGFLDIDPIRYTGQYNSNEFYYIFLQQPDHFLLETMRDIFQYCWQHHLINCNIQVQFANGTIFVYTYFPYKAGSRCGCTEPTLINEFRKDGIGMSDLNLFPSKLRNMNNCPVRVITLHNPPYVRLTPNSNGSVVLGGFESLLVRTLATHLNFQIDLIRKVDRTGVEFAEQLTMVTPSIDGAVQMLKHGLVDLVYGSVYQGPMRSKTATALHGYHKVVRILCVLRSARAQRYTSLEVLTFPFQVQSWVFVSLLLLGGCFGIALCQRFKKGTISKQFDFIAIALGMPTTKVPAVHHNRLIYMDWTLCSLLFRCIYTALLYDLFCSNLYRKPPDTIDGLIAENYTIVMNRDVSIGLGPVAQFNVPGIRREILTSIDEAAAFRFLEKNAWVGGKMAAMGSRDILLYYGRQNSKAGQYHILPEVVFQQQLTMYVSKHSFLISQLNEMILWIHAAGLLEYWVSWDQDVRYFNSRHLETKKFIGQTELSGIYYVCGVLILISLIVFGLELCSGRLKQMFVKNLTED